MIEKFLAKLVYSLAEKGISALIGAIMDYVAKKRREAKNAKTIKGALDDSDAQDRANRMRDILSS